MIMLKEAVARVWVLSLHLANLGSIPSSTYGFLSTARFDPQIKRNKIKYKKT